MRAPSSFTTSGAINDNSVSESALRPTSSSAIPSPVSGRRRQRSATVPDRREEPARSTPAPPGDLWSRCRRCSRFRWPLDECVGFDVDEDRHPVVEVAQAGDGVECSVPAGPVHLGHAAERPGPFDDEDGSTPARAASGPAPRLRRSTRSADRRWVDTADAPPAPMPLTAARVRPGLPGTPARDRPRDFARAPAFR